MRINMIGFMILVSLVILAGCAGRQFVRTDVRQDVKSEKIIKSEPVADMSAIPDKPQSQTKNGVTAEVVYLRKMNSADYKCLNREEDPLNPNLLFAFRILNDSEEVKYYNPVFVFKGVKTLDMANSDPCRFFSSYGAVNYILAKPGSTVALSCQSRDNEETRTLTKDHSETVELYPEVPVYGILIVSQQQLDQASKVAGRRSTIKGWAAFFEKVQSGVKPTSFRFDYEFTRKDWYQDVEYKQNTPFTYKVDVYQNTKTIPIVGTINGDLVEERQPGSEEYRMPNLTRIGVVSGETKK